ncbi:hypothetical protein SMICM304S_00119 [Streptomyces microflavus]
MPLIPALIGCGIIAGLNGLLVNLGWLPAVTPALAAMAPGFMALIAVFVGYNTAKEFGGTPILGGAVAAIIVFLGVANIDAFGETLSPGQGGVLGALGAAVLAVYVEKWCRRWVPEALDVLVTPTLTVLISGLVTIFGLMYVAGEVSSAIGTFADWLLANGGAGAGFVLGGLFLPLVMLGLHQALIPIHTTLIEQQGYTVLLPILAMAGAGQVGAAMAVYFRLPRNESIRRTIRSALPAGLLGVGEPLIYGVSLPLGRPFITACVGGAFGGGFVGLFNQLGDKVGSTAIGPSGWALFPLVDGNHGLGTTIAIYAGGLLVGYVAGFAATYFAHARLVNATPGGVSVALLHSIGAPALAGTLLIDVGVGLSDDFTELTHPNSSLGELIQEAFPLTPVVKTLCTMDSTTMTAPGELTEPGTVFLSGDDIEAKRTTGHLLTDLGWPPSSQLDIGGITTARGQEHFAFLFMGIAGGVGSHTFNIKVVTRPRTE